MSSDLVPTALSNGDLLGACVAPVAVAGAFVLIRLFNSWKVTGNFHLDDWMAVLALIVLVALAVLSYLGSTIPNDPSTPLATTPQVFTALLWVNPAGLYFGKVPLLIMVLRIFETSKWVRINSYIVLIVPVILFTGGAIYATTYCSTVGKIVTIDYVAGCLRTGLALGVWNGAVAIASDVIILAIPVPVVFKLNIPNNKKIGLLLLFLTGILTLIASAVTIYYKSSALEGRPANIIGSVIGALLEAAIALVVSCLPAIRALWVAHVARSRLYNGLVGMVTTTRPRKMERTPTSSQIPTVGNERSASSVSHTYIELTESRSGWADRGYSGRV